MLGEVADGDPIEVGRNAASELSAICFASHDNAKLALSITYSKYYRTLVVLGRVLSIALLYSLSFIGKPKGRASPYGRSKSFTRKKVDFAGARGCTHAPFRSCVGRDYPKRYGCTHGILGNGGPAARPSALTSMGLGFSRGTQRPRH